mmetsp:Transcript_19560/g.29440  ORF Transcript_19560/g.29440 Transcript_19560/m.29440 type:complete len:104 (-) Transcript_19560:143-454(-)
MVPYFDRVEHFGPPAEEFADHDSGEIVAAVGLNSYAWEAEDARQRIEVVVQGVQNDDLLAAEKEKTFDRMLATDGVVIVDGTALEVLGAVEVGPEYQSYSHEN